MLARSVLICSLLTFPLIISEVFAAEKDQSSERSLSRYDVETALKDYAKSQQRLEEALSKTRNREERRRIRESLQPKPVPQAEDFITWATEHRHDELAADVLILIITHGEKTAPVRSAAELLAKEHRDLGGKRFMRVAGYVLGNLEPPVAEDWTRDFIKHAKSRQTQALACFALATFKMGQVRYAQMLQNPVFRKEIQGRFDERQIKYFETIDISKTNAAAERLFEQLITEFPDIEFQGKKIADVIKPQYFAVSKLAIGKAAPEIEGIDLDGQPMRLSDYRGKVVVLNFWGSWCKPCMKMLPHHNKLAAQHRDQPFAFLGIATDKDRKQLDTAIREQGVTWRNWWDGDDTGHAISKKWAIQQWPTIFVLDHKGVIRHKHLFDEQLDAAVEKLLQQVSPHE